MTIISAVYVPDGIVLSADSRLTGTFKKDDGTIERYAISDNSQKIVLIRNSTIGVVLYGNGDVDGKNVTTFISLFNSTYIDEQDTVEVVSKKLKEQLIKCEVHDSFFILAGYDGDEPFVYEVTSKKVERKNFEDNKVLYSACWAGNTVPVKKMFDDVPIRIGLMQLKDAVDFAGFIVDVGIKYSRFTELLSDCGGPTDILVITKDYTHFVKHKLLNP